MSLRSELTRLDKSQATRNSYHAPHHSAVKLMEEDKMTTLYDKDYTELSSGGTDFGICDQKGRAVGYHWRIFKVIYTAVPEGRRSGYISPNGLPLEHLEVAAFPTRDGKHYGASSGNMHCLTEAEAQAIIAKRTAAAHKRDTKKFKLD